MLGKVGAEMKVITYETYQGELPYLVKESEATYPTAETLNSPKDIVGMVNTVFRLNERAEEYVYMLALDTAGHLLGVFEISHGVVNGSFSRPREIFQRALLCSAVNIVLLHNHPSGNVKPSKDDLLATRKVKEIEEMLCIPLLDHLIVGKDGYYSFKEEGGLG